VVPALAVADALQAEGAHVVFVGGERAERTMVPAAGYELRPIAVEGLSRRNPLKAARAAGRAALAVRTARAILRDVEPDAVLGAGGYVAGPVGLAAAARRVPLVLAEADSHLGLTNRLLARWARRVCLAFPIAGRGAPATRVPYPYASADHQSSNARWMVQAGAALLVPDAELDAKRLADAVGALLGDPARLRAMGEASAALARPDAAQRIAAEVLAAAAR
jgi:UDP-N-acetylglucosamine--N-acetylmuramyl-(pentapeptide) pyrophosphoryl-undecaprenol N-acetylglucosamine transferase